MSYPIAQLQASINRKDSTFGRVVSVSGEQVICATPQGRRVATPAGTLRTGARVLIRGSVAYLAPDAGVSVAV